MAINGFQEPIRCQFLVQIDSAEVRISTRKELGVYPQIRLDLLYTKEYNKTMNYNPMEKSLQYYNYINDKKLADIRANKIWANTENPPLPKYQPIKREKDKVWWSHFFITTLKGLQQLKP